MACEDLQARCNAYRAAYDNWLTTGGLQTVRDNGKLVSRNPMDGKALRVELSRAEDALAACQGVRAARRRILRVLPIG